jgi:argininosuccinate lyase
VSDDLVGSSSMMPQKRNPFLFEHVQGKAAGCLGSFAGAVSAMLTAPYTNAIAVGTEGVTHLWAGLQNMTDATDLLRLLVAGTEPMEERMLRRAEDGNTVATHLAELLVRSGVAFRTAHHRVGKMVTVALRTAQSLPTVAADSLRGEFDGTGIDASGLTPATVVRAARYGGGPGSATTPERLGELGCELLRLRRVLTGRQERWERARGLLNEAVQRAEIT